MTVANGARSPPVSIVTFEPVGGVFTMVEYTSVASLLVVSTPPPVLLAVFPVIVELVTVAGLVAPNATARRRRVAADRRRLDGDEHARNAAASAALVVVDQGVDDDDITVKAWTAAPPVLPVTVEPSARTSAGPPTLRRWRHRHLR